MVGPIQGIDLSKTVLPGISGSGQAISPDAYLKSMSYDFNGNPAPIGSPTNVLSQGRDNYATPNTSIVAPSTAESTPSTPSLQASFVRTPTPPLTNPIGTPMQQAQPELPQPMADPNGSFIQQLVKALGGGR